VAAPHVVIFSAKAKSGDEVLDNNASRTLGQRLTAMHPLLRSIPDPLRIAVLSRSAVSHDRRYVYVRVPKAANSTISKTLAWLTFPDERDAVQADENGRVSKHLFSKYPWYWFSPENAARGYFKFMFVRDPFSRVLSAYLDKVNPGFDRNGFAFVGAASGKRPSELSFGDFIGFLETGGLLSNIHWAPQVDLCPFPLDQLDLVGKIETIDQDMAIVGREIFRQTNLPIQQRETRRTNSSDKLAQYYDAGLINRVAKLYERDFDAFGYLQHP
jgi:hypothetical protein